MEIKQESLKQIADDFAKIKGNVRGEMFRTHLKFIKQIKGNEGASAVKQKLSELGCPVYLNKIQPLEWYQEGYSILTILTAYSLFNWQESDVYALGLATPKFSFLVKLMTKFFLSPKKGYYSSPRYWQTYFDFGKFEAPIYDDQKKYCIVRLSDYKTHPLACIFYGGCFVTFGQLVNLGRAISIKETKCVFNGDPYHEWVVSWS